MRAVIRTLGTSIPSGLIKGTLIAHFIHRYAPHRRGAALAIWQPLIHSVKALRTNVARQHPENRLSNPRPVSRARAADMSAVPTPCPQCSGSTYNAQSSPRSDLWASCAGAVVAKPVITASSRATIVCGWRGSSLPNCTSSLDLRGEFCRGNRRETGCGKRPAMSGHGHLPRPWRPPARLLAATYAYDKRRIPELNVLYQSTALLRLSWLACKC